MVLVEGNLLFLVPKCLSKEDLEFNVYTQDGNFIGTNIGGISPRYISDTKQRNHLEELIDIEALKTEVKLKFYKEYGVPIEHYKELAVKSNEILNTMVTKWHIPFKAISEFVG